MKIEAEEADCRTGEDDRDGRSTDQTVGARHDEHGGQREERRAGREPIQAVDQVERVRDADEPEDGEEHADDAAELDRADKWQRKRRDTEASDEDAARDDDLRQKLPARAHWTN